MSGLRLSVVLATLLSVKSFAADAATYNFTGEISYVFDSVYSSMHPVSGSFLGHPFSKGEGFHGTLEVTNTDSNSDPNNGQYQSSGQHMTVQFDNGFSISATTALMVQNDAYSSVIDRIYFSAFGKTPSQAITLTHSVTGDTGSVTYAGPTFRLDDTDATVFSGDSLPNGSVDLSQFEVNSFSMTMLSNDFSNAAGNTVPNVRINGYLTSFEIAAVPLPAGLPMILAAIASLGVLKLRNRVSA